MGTATRVRCARLCAVMRESPPPPEREGTSTENLDERPVGTPAAAPAATVLDPLSFGVGSCVMIGGRKGTIIWDSRHYEMEGYDFIKVYWADTGEESDELDASAVTSLIPEEDVGIVKMAMMRILSRNGVSQLMGYA